MRVLAKVELPVQPDKVDQMAKLLIDILPDTRSFEGCLGIHAFQGQEDPTRFVLVEFWQSRQAHERYIGWRQETGVLGEIVSMLSGAPDIQYFDQLEA